MSALLCCRHRHRHRRRRSVAAGPPFQAAANNNINTQQNNASGLTPLGLTVPVLLKAKELRPGQKRRGHFRARGPHKTTSTVGRKWLGQNILTSFAWHTRDDPSIMRRRGRLDGTANRRTICRIWLKILDFPAFAQF